MSSSPMNSSPAPRRASLGLRLRQWFMLRPAEHQVTKRTVGQSSEIRFYLERAAAQYDAAHAMLEGDNVNAALEFAKASAVLHARALLTAEGIGEVASFPD